MDLVSQMKYSAKDCSDRLYYRIKESYRNAKGNVCTRILLNIGFIDPEPTPQQWRAVLYRLNERQKHGGQPILFADESDPLVSGLVELFWSQMSANGSIDTVERAKHTEIAKMRSMIDADTMEHREAREIGGENICLQAIEQLKIIDFLRDKGWEEDRIRYSIAHLIVRCLYSPSELKSMKIMNENSAVCELLGVDPSDVTRYNTYNVAPELYKLKEELDAHLCSRTDSLFNLTNKICLFDLTNFYYEGRKEHSAKARFGRSKEKRSDCKLTVLALCINAEGFIRHSELLAGNIADPSSLPAMVETLLKRAPGCGRRPQDTLVVMDAGIATEDNLSLLKQSGFNYLCVCRRKLNGSDYTIKADSETVVVTDTLSREIKLTRVECNKSNGDYYLRIDSPAKAVKEGSMLASMRQRYEDGLQKIAGAITRKGGTKRFDKVWERIGRLSNQYPSVAKHYSVTVAKSDSSLDIASSMQWTCTSKIDETFNGVYFMRTNVATLDERTTWDYYNLIREIECTNRQLKTDLSLRPIHHQKDTNCDAHLYLGLLAYWIVNTIRYQLKEEGEKMYWTEIVYA